MMRWTAIALALWAMAAGPMAEVEPTVLRILSRELKFSADELAALDGGAIVKHALPTPEPGEIAVVGATLVKATKETLIDRVRDIAQFKR